VRYLQFARELNARFPGFGTDIHGLVKEETDSGTQYFLDCVRAG
jgi:arginine decarboxylase